MAASWLCRAALSRLFQAQRAWICPLTTALPASSLTSVTAALPLMSSTAAGGWAKATVPSAANSLSSTAARRTPRSTASRCWMPQPVRAVMASAAAWVDTDAARL